MKNSIVISPRPLSGSLDAIPSKSHVHRLLICAALGTGEVFVPCPSPSQDIMATARCLTALGASVRATGEGLRVSPLKERPGARIYSGDAPPARLDCGESGSTYRFLAPVAAALGIPVVFHLSGRLPVRPMDQLWAALKSGGARIDGRGSPEVAITGGLRPGRYEIPGNISSQFISGLLLALPRLQGDSEIVITGALESAGYIELTLEALRSFSVNITPTPTGFIIPGGQDFIPPAPVIIPEGDWSNAALWLCAGAVAGEGITIRGLSPDSPQGDRAIAGILRRFGAGVEQSESGNSVSVTPAPISGITLDTGDIPDLVPSVALLGAAAAGITKITGVSRLTLKESDRRISVCETLNSLGSRAEYDGDTITIFGGGSGPHAGGATPTKLPLAGGTADSRGDHRIAMLAAAASVLARGEITLDGVGALDKSYPGFLEHFKLLGGVIK